MDIQCGVCGKIIHDFDPATAHILCPSCIRSLVDRKPIRIHSFLGDGDMLIISVAAETTEEAVNRVMKLRTVQKGWRRLVVFADDGRILQQINREDVDDIWRKRKEKMR